MVPTIDQLSSEPEPNVVICGWRTKDAKHDMSPEQLLSFY